MTATTAAPPGLFALDELRDLIDRHTGDDVSDLLDEIGLVVRRARAAIRRAQPKPPKVDPATPKPSPQPAAPPQPGAGSVPAPGPGARPDGSAADVGMSVTSTPSATAAATSRAPVVGAVVQQHPDQEASGHGNEQPARAADLVADRRIIFRPSPDQRGWSRAVPWLPLLVLALAVLLAVLIGVGPAAAAFTLPALPFWAPARIDVRPPGRT